MIARRALRPSLRALSVRGSRSTAVRTPWHERSQTRRRETAIEPGAEQPPVRSIHFVRYCTTDAGLATPAASSLIHKGLVASGARLRRAERNTSGDPESSTFVLVDWNSRYQNRFPTRVNWVEAKFSFFEMSHGKLLSQRPDTRQENRCFVGQAFQPDDWGRQAGKPDLRQ